MPALSRRHDPDARQQAWRIHFGDIAAIAESIGNRGAAPKKLEVGASGFMTIKRGGLR
jgi:hypothetical protein